MGFKKILDDYGFYLDRTFQIHRVSCTDSFFYEWTKREDNGVTKRTVYKVSSTQCVKIDFDELKQATVYGFLSQDHKAIELDITGTGDVEYKELQEYISEKYFDGVPIIIFREYELPIIPDLYKLINIYNFYVVPMDELKDVTFSKSQQKILNKRKEEKAISQTIQTLMLDNVQQALAKFGGRISVDNSFVYFTSGDLNELLREALECTVGKALKDIGIEFEFNPNKNWLNPSWHIDFNKCKLTGIGSTSNKGE